MSSEPEQTTPWNRDVIMSRLRAVLDADEFSALEQRLSGAIDGAESAWLEHVVKAASTLALPAPPEALSQRLRDMFVARPRQQTEAVLVNDSRIERQLVGVRGGAEDDGWTLSYSTEVGNLLIDVWPSGEALDVEAQLMSATAHAEYTMRMVGPSRYESTSDRLGRVSVDGVVPGRYELVIERPDHEVRASVDLSGSP